MALNAFEKGLALHEAATDEVFRKALRGACIQRFVFCIELAWKTSAKMMGSMSTGSKVVVREMAQNGYIDSPEAWFDFIDARNKTSHTYDNEIAVAVFAVAKRFLPEGRELLNRLGRQ